MIKYLMILIVVLAGFTANATSTITKNGNVFSTTKVENKSIVTPYFFELNGVKYPIKISAKGCCFIEVISKNGKPYKKYLGRDISIQICKELGIEYKGK